MAVYMFKKCSKCNNKHYGKGLCQKHYDEIYKKVHAIRIKNYLAEYYKRHKKSKAISMSEYYNKNKKHIRENRLKRTFDITLEQYDQMLKDQDDKCAICGKKPTERYLSIDHDHKTDKIRGLLCDSCNLLLGHANDDPVILGKSIDYLSLHIR